jgi:bifunctional non-homologous end joining protein LigD
VFEEKVDGWRIVAYKEGQCVSMVSRHGVDRARRLADIAAAIAKLSACTLVLDGAIAIYDQQLRSCFAGCASRIATPSPRRRCSWRSTWSTTTGAT